MVMKQDECCTRDKMIFCLPQFEILFFFAIHTPSLSLGLLINFCAALCFASRQCHRAFCTKLQVLTARGQPCRFRLAVTTPHLAWPPTGRTSLWCARGRHTRCVSICAFIRVLVWCYPCIHSCRIQFRVTPGFFSLA